MSPPDGSQTLSINYDWQFSDFVGRVEQLASEGFRLLSLSMYDQPSRPLFAAVWDWCPGRALELEARLHDG